MTPAEYIQLKAFARVDGAWVALLWTVSFACYLVGLRNPLFGMIGLLLLIASPFWVARRLRRFRDEDLHGVISLMRGWAFYILVFFYAGVLMALVQYAYFAYLDHGYLMSSFNDALMSPEAKQAFGQYGLSQSLSETLQMLSELRPIDYALNVLTMTILMGIVLGLPVAALTRRGVNNS